MDVVMPQVGETEPDAAVLAWYVAVGDQVSQNQPICEIESDKASIEIPAPTAGIITSIRVAAGNVASAGTVIATIDNTT